MVVFEKMKANENPEKKTSCWSMSKVCPVTVRSSTRKNVMKDRDFQGKLTEGADFTQIKLVGLRLPMKPPLARSRRKVCSYRLKSLIRERYKEKKDN